MGPNATLGDSSYGRISASVIDLCNQLRELGVSSDIKLPTLATAGNQSSGKSSVVEAIAGIPLPRSSGTCTRCPTEVRMRRCPPAITASNTGWLCRIKLKREYDTDGRKLPEVPPEELFATITRQEDITLCVSAAQAVLLNPKVVLQRNGHAAYVPQNLDSGTSVKHSDAYDSLGDTDYELEFTSNCVILEIEGAEADLTIVDLPGIIQSHPKGQHYVDMIKSMVVRYIEPEHVIIVMTLTAMDDLENQAINLESRKVDPQGLRTIGVITKPDNIPTGEHDKWLALAKNENLRQTLALGYYVVKNPGQKQLNEGITFSDARQRELDFFSSDVHWASAEVELGGRLGTSNLRNALSDMLVRRIVQELPVMYQHALLKLKETNAKMRGLPPEPSKDLQFEFQSLVQKVGERLEAEVRGKTPGDKHTLQAFAAIYEQFEVALKAEMPIFKVKNETIGSLKMVESDARGDKTTTLEFVKELRAQHLGHELPTFSPYSALEKLIEKFKGKWRGAAEDCLDSIKEELHRLMSSHVASVFDQFPGMKLRVSEVLATHLEDMCTTCKQRLVRLVGMEEYDTFTMNTHYFIDSKAAFLARLKRANLPPAGMLSKEQEATAINILALAGIKCSKLDELFLAQATPDDDELNLMAATLAYFKVAFKRILDAVPLHIRDYLLHSYVDKHGLSKVVHERILSCLDDGVGAKEELISLMQEDHSVSAKRRQLIGLAARLEKAVKVIQRQNPARKESISEL